MIEDKKGHPLEKLRAAGVTWYFIAKQLGVNHITVRNWRKGMSSPNPENLEAIKKLEVEVGCG